MVVNDFDFGGPCLGPLEADPVLVVDPDAVLPLPVYLQRLEPIPRRHPEIVQDVGLV